MKKMKRVFITGLLTLTSAILIAASPIKRETVYSIVKQNNSLEWFEVQAKLWVEELERDNTKPESWLNTGK